MYRRGGLSLSERANETYNGKKAAGIERGNSVKGGRSPRFRVQESARRRPVSAFGRNRTQAVDFFDSLGPPRRVLARGTFL